MPLSTEKIEELKIRREKVKELWDQGLSGPKIGKILGVGSGTIYRDLNTMGINASDYTEGRYTLFDKEQEWPNVEDLYLNKGYSCKDIGQIYNVSDEVIRKLLNSHNIKMRTPAEGVSIEKEKYDDTVFEKIDNPLKAYLLGFIAADGYVTKDNEFGLTINPKDDEVIYLLSYLLQYRKTPSYFDKNGHSSVQIRFGSKKICNDLSKYGIINNKTFTYDPKETIEHQDFNKEFEKDFLLGMWDGDGSISYSFGHNKTTRQWITSITGTKETCDYFNEKVFNNKGFFTKRHQDEKNNYTCSLSGRNLVAEALNPLYQNSMYRLTRKFKKFVCCFNKIVPLFCEEQSAVEEPALGCGENSSLTVEP